MGVVHFMHVNKQIVFGVFSLLNEPTWILDVVYEVLMFLDCHQVWIQV